MLLPLIFSVVSSDLLTLLFSSTRETRQSCFDLIVNFFFRHFFYFISPTSTSTLASILTSVPTRISFLAFSINSLYIPSSYLSTSTFPLLFFLSRSFLLWVFKLLSINLAHDFKTLQLRSCNSHHVIFRIFSSIRLRSFLWLVSHLPNGSFCFLRFHL